MFLIFNMTYIQRVTTNPDAPTLKMEVNSLPSRLFEMFGRGTIRRNMAYEPTNMRSQTTVIKVMRGRRREDTVIPPMSRSL